MLLPASSSGLHSRSGWQEGPARAGLSLRVSDCCTHRYRPRFPCSPSLGGTQSRGEHRQGSATTESFLVGASHAQERT